MNSLVHRHIVLKNANDNYFNEFCLIFGSVRSSRSSFVCSFLCSSGPSSQNFTS